MQQLREAKSQGPASALVLSWLSYGYYLSGRLDSALVESRRALENDSTNFTTNAFGALVRLAVGRNEEALALGRRTTSLNTLSAFVIARAGDTAGARRALSVLDSESPRRTRFWTEKAFTHLGLRETEKALEAFEAATDSGEMWPLFEPVTDRIFDDLRASPRFALLLRRVNLPESLAVRRSPAP